MPYPYPTGLMIYCLDCKSAGLRIYDGFTWAEIGAGPSVAAIVAASNDPAADGTPSLADLTNAGVTGATGDQTAYEEAIAAANPAPTTLAELQAIIDAVNVSPDCDANGFEGGASAYVNGAAFTTTNKFSITLENIASSDATIYFATTDVSLSCTASAGITVSAVSPASVTIAPGNTATVEYTLSGTPANEGTLIADWSKLSLSCQRTTNILKGDATFTLPQTASVVSLCYAGPPIVDIQGVVDNATNQIIVNVPYTGGIGTYDAYTSAAVAVTGEGGDNNTITISYPAGTFAADGTIPVTVTVDGDGSFNVAKQALVVTTTFATLDFQANGVSKGNVLLDASGGVKDRAYGDGIHDFVYIPVVAEDGNTWLNNNLGADYADTNHASFNLAQQATAHNDHLAYGSLYQWGRNTDEHQIRTSSVTAGPVASGSEGSNFITIGTTPYEWLNTQDDTRWGATKTANDPCPDGYRVPTEAELESERIFFSTNNVNGAYASLLKLTAAGNRNPITAAFNSVGTNGYYWSSTVNGSNARNLSLYNNTAYMNDNARAFGFAVRCIKE